MRRFIAAAAVCIVAGPLRAQDHQHTPGMQHPAAATPKEGGQSAFTAIAEVVKLLDADPRTDWSKVNVEALRQHLIDMDEVTMRATVRAEIVDGGAAFVVTGSGRTLEAIRRMTRSRAVARIRGLGFSGVVALGDHHAPHHLGIANGSMAGMHGH